MDHTFTLPRIGVSCNSLFSSQCVDPNFNDTTSSAIFTIRAADYCDGQRALVINGMAEHFIIYFVLYHRLGLAQSPTTSTRVSPRHEELSDRPCHSFLSSPGAITIKAFVPQRELSRIDATPIRGYKVDEYAYLTLFIDAAKSLKVLFACLLYSQGRLSECTSSSIRLKVILYYYFESCMQKYSPFSTCRCLR